MEKQFSLDAIHEAAHWLWDQVKGYTVLAFHGEMGAGKTTLIHALCEVKGVTSTVSSPTFSIINEYRFPGGNGQEDRLYHMDLYRLRDEEEALQAGVEDSFYSGHTCLVEWPEKAPGLFPAGTVHIYLEPVNPSTRKLRIERN